jgi:hypothetical protein
MNNDIQKGQLGVQGKRGLTGPPGPPGTPNIYELKLYLKPSFSTTDIENKQVLLELYKIHNLVYLVLNINFTDKFTMNTDDGFNIEFLYSSKNKIQYFSDNLDVRHVIPVTYTIDDKEVLDLLIFRIKRSYGENINTVRLYFGTEKFDDYNIVSSGTISNIKINTVVNWII